MPSSTSNFKMQLARPFDEDVVIRTIPERPWRRLAIVALVATIGLVTVWEMYWRDNWYETGDYKGTFGLWAKERRNATGDATVLIGASRIFYGINLDVWEDAVGIRPIQLAIDGATPQPFLADLAADQSFNGLVIVGVAPQFFYTGFTIHGEILNYVKRESPSQKLSQVLLMYIDPYFAFLDEFTRPETIIRDADLPLREGMTRRMTPRKLNVLEADRNAKMWDRVVGDEEYKQLAKDIWASFLDPWLVDIRNPSSPTHAKNAKLSAEIILQIKDSVDAIRARGGDVVFLRMPVDGRYDEWEPIAYPREKAWDKLLFETNSIGIHFKDYPALQGHHVVEWSHLAAPDAIRFTSELVPILYDQLEKRK